VLPGSTARYGELEVIYAHGYSESTVWRGVRVTDGLPVALKRIVEDVWSSERELSMHLAANDVPGICIVLFTIPTLCALTSLLHRCGTTTGHVLGSSEGSAR
jgi:hypothetical protein